MNSPTRLAALEVLRVELVLYIEEYLRRITRTLPKSDNIPWVAMGWEKKNSTMK